MTQRMILSVVAVLLWVAAAPVEAQSVERIIEVNQADWGSFRVTPIEADGDMQTREWLVVSPQLGELSSNTRLRVVAERHGQMCVGDWFSVSIPGQRWWMTLAWVRVGARDMIQATEFGPLGSLRVSLVALSRPAC
jgi:hypothetical protein